MGSQLLAVLYNSADAECDLALRVFVDRKLRFDLILQLYVWTAEVFTVMRIHGSLRLVPGNDFGSSNTRMD
jgi:hypothetical protein